MGFGSPLVGAYGTVVLSGYYLVYGAEVALQRDVRPVGLHNAIAGRTPTYFELFPTARGTAHAALILPVRSAKPGVPLRAEWDFILSQTPYAEVIEGGGLATPETYFGIIPRSAGRSGPHSTASCSSANRRSPIPRPARRA